MRFKRIYVEITNRCNLNCSFCKKITRPKTDMSVSDFRVVSKNVKQFTDYIYLHLKGEPLIHPNLNEILDICFETGLKVNITTNGTDLKNVLDILREKNCIRQVNISLQALEQVLNKDEYLENVIKLIDISKEKNFYVSLRIWVDNKDVNDYAYLYLKDIVKEQAESVFWSFDTEFEWPDIDGEFVSDYGTCLGTKNHIGILVNGDVVPCCLDGDGVVVFGNVLNESLSDILSSSRYLKMREGFNNNQLTELLCKKCKYRRK